VINRNAHKTLGRLEPADRARVMNQLRERQMELGRVVFSNDDPSDQLLALLQRLTEAVERIEKLLAHQVLRRPSRIEDIIEQKG
jgi:hypothetical protein